MNLPNFIPRKNKDLKVIIQLGDQKIIKDNNTPTMKQMKNYPNTPQRKLFNKQENIGLDTQKNQTRSTSKSIHKLSVSPKPRMNTPTPNTSRKNQQSVITKRIKDIKMNDSASTEDLKNMLHDFLVQKENSGKNTHKKSNNSIVQRLINTNKRKISQPLNYQNLDVLTKYYWEYYEGQTLNDKKHGHGTLYFTNKQKFTGNFVNNMASGNGTYYQKSGKVVIGIWKNNELQKRII